MTTPPAGEPATTASRRRSRPTTPPRAAEPSATPPPRRPRRRRNGQRRASRVVRGNSQEAFLEGNTFTVTVLALVTATVIGGLLCAFTNTTVLDAPAGQHDRAGVGRRLRHLRGAVRGVGVQPAHGRGAVPAGLAVDRGPRRVPVGRVQPAVGDRGPGDAADPHRARGRAAVPGRACSTSAGRASSSAARSWPPGSATTSACRSSCTWSSASSAGSSAARSLGWLAGEIKARTGAHEVIVTIMLNYVMLYLLAYLLSSQSLLQAPGGSNPITPADRVQRPPAAAGRDPPAHQRRLPDRAGRRLRRVVAAEPDDHRVRVPQRRRQRLRLAGRRDERGALLGAGDADRRRARRAGRVGGHPGHRLHAEPAELRHLRDRRDHRRAARPGIARRRGGGRAAVRRAARGVARACSR